MFLNIPIPDIFHIGENIRQKYNSHYVRMTGLDSRNSVILEPLEQNLFKLEDIRIRIGTRIEKEMASGTDMTSALNLLSFADTTLDFTRNAVALATSTTSTIDTKPSYLLIQDAYSSINQSRESLSAVLKAIEQAVNKSQ